MRFVLVGSSNHVSFAWKLVFVGRAMPYKNRLLQIVSHRWFKKESEWLSDIKAEASFSYNSYLSRPFG